jgi:hypothetical protein
MIRTSTGRTATVALTLLVVAFLSAPPANAQGFDPERARQRMSEQVGETVKALELEGETADTVRSILMARVEKRMELFASMRPGEGRGPEGMREAMAKLDTEAEGRLAGVLTKEQVDAWKAHEEALRSRMRRGPRG